MSNSINAPGGSATVGVGGNIYQCPQCSNWVMQGATCQCQWYRPSTTVTQPLTTGSWAAAAAPPVRIAMREGATMPTRGTSRSVGLDIAICEDVTIPARGHKLAPTGLIMAPPTNYWLMLVGRSSLIKRGLILANAVGIIDPDYCGPDDEILLSLYNVTDEPVHVAAGSRLAQAIVLPLNMHGTTQMEPGAVSRGGFGSSGV